VEAEQQLGEVSDHQDWFSVNFCLMIQKHLRTS